MRIALFGGVFDSEMATYSASAPEIVLQRFLRAQGHDVVGASSRSPDPFGVAADVHHAHHFGPAAYALALSGGTFVFTSHNPFLVSDFPERGSRLDARLQRPVLAAASAIVALSAREADLLSARFGIDRDRFAVIPNGLDLALYRPGATRPGSGVSLLSVGQLTPYKGHMYLLDAMTRLPGDVRLTIVSHVRDPRNEVIARIAELGLGDRVELVGPLDTPALVERYRACDVFVQPSLAECFPVTVLEAMACARPIVATDVGGVSEELGDAGIVVPPGDARALGNALEPLVADPARREALGEAAHERAQALYGGDRVAAEHVRLYESLPSRRPSHVRRTAARAAIALYERRGALIGRR
jgi:glycosyltransferase involved in cell wall biosynthesis